MIYNLMAHRHEWFIGRAPIGTYPVDLMIGKITYRVLKGNMAYARSFGKVDEMWYIFEAEKITLINNIFFLGVNWESIFSRNVTLSNVKTTFKTTNDGPSMKDQLSKLRVHKSFEILCRKIMKHFFFLFIYFLNHWIANWNDPKLHPQIRLNAFMGSVSLFPSFLTFIINSLWIL